MHVVGDARLVAARQDIRGGWHRHLERAGRMLVQEARLVLGQAALLAEFLGDHAGLGRRSLPGGVARRGVEHRDRRFARAVAVHRLDEVARPAAAAELAVAKDVDADLLLQLQHAQDRSVFELTQVRGGQTTCAMRRVRLLDFRRSQKTADLVRAIRRRHRVQDAAAAAPAAALARSSSISVRRRILPDADLGIASVNCSLRMRLCGATRAATYAMMSSAGVGVLTTTNALGTSPASSSGLGMTAASATAGWPRRMASSSAGATCRPLYLISSLTRSTMKVSPSGST